jgi:hypothetical protein
MRHRMNTRKLRSPFIVKLEKRDTKYGSIVLRLSGMGFALGQDTGKIDITMRINVINSLALDTRGLMGKRYVHTCIEERTKELRRNSKFIHCMNIIVTEKYIHYFRHLDKIT